MNIAVFTDSFLPGNGGTERATYHLCKSLIELGHKIILFAPDYHREQTVDGLDVERVKSLKLTSTDMAVLCRLEFNKILKKVKVFEPDIIYYCTATGMAKCAIKVGKILNKPVVATIHTKFKDAFYDGTKSKLISNILVKSLVAKLNKTDKVITVSYDMARELNKYGYKNEVVVIKNGIDGISAVEDYQKKHVGIYNFMYCGHLYKCKNIQFSLKSLGCLKREKGFTNFKFTIVGDGNYKKALSKLAKKENLLENVEFTGYISDRNRLAEIYKNSDLFLFPSTFDTDGLVVCEAARQGTPSLTIKDFGASERITDNKNGFISEYDIDSYANRIYEILNDRQLYDHVRQNVCTLAGNTWLEIAKSYEELFLNLLKTDAKEDVRFAKIGNAKGINNN